ncbi:hypothetical protein N7462_001754 [Penicillium macrosclerotiorum]|uniref:uncharacterized protein n=1 Tax=Penicillium macrosclerotiorum TaxID=303699 RepID=UPI00254875EA|nr:uncharacterized protein N7462_001754 [Penicillium macrosclerotiorum]KAJ5692331.1 hypothetical protein N7462_001754 [Penicillium macrosclerotiorum]
MSNTADLTATLTSVLSNLPPPEKIQDAERMQLYGIISQLQAALEPPQVAIQRFCFSHYGIVVIRVAQGMGIFDAFSQSKNAEMTLNELSLQTKGDEVLLKRVMRFLCSHQIFQETENQTYRPLPLGMAFGSVAGDMIKHFHTNMQVTAKLFDYFESKGYKNPENSEDAPFQFAYNTSDHYFKWLQKHPAAQQSFNTVMTTSQSHRGEDWFKIYPVTEKLNVSPDQILLVDIGGGVGHDLIAFKKQFPELPGKLALQDLPQVIDTIKEPLSGDICVTPHDMFKPQPIRGAKAYYMRTVLHDFPDKQALEALAHIREAMAEDSVLLIHEHTLPEGSNIPPLAATLDLHMMEIFSSLERTEEQWTNLLKKAGFRTVHVWKAPPGGQSSAVFEATL